MSGGDISAPGDGAAPADGAVRKRARRPACDGCRKAHVACSGTTPCERCARRGTPCTGLPYEAAARTTLDRALAALEAALRRPECDASVIERLTRMCASLAPGGAGAPAPLPTISPRRTSSSASSPEMALPQLAPPCAGGAVPDFLDLPKPVTLLALVTEALRLSGNRCVLTEADPAMAAERRRTVVATIDVAGTMAFISEPLAKGRPAGLPMETYLHNGEHDRVRRFLRIMAIPPERRGGRVPSGCMDVAEFNPEMGKWVRYSSFYDFDADGGFVSASISFHSLEEMRLIARLSPNVPMALPGAPQEDFWAVAKDCLITEDEWVL